jgi:monoamine oxidase
VLDAIVVGAGLSGLVCARKLVSGGAKIAVLEARERVGGRLHTGRVGDALVDLGGHWLTAGQPRLAALAEELDVAIEQHERKGKTILGDDGGLAAAFAQWRAMRRIERRMKRIGDPVRGDAVVRAEHDRQTLAEYLAGEIANPTVRGRIALHADLVFATDPAALSLLYYLQTMRATSGFRPQARDEYRFVGGAQLLAQRLGEQLGDRVHVNEPVTAIVQSRTSITVNTYEAKHAVLAIPPPLVRTIAVELPPGARAHVQAAFGGPVVKCFAAYDRPTWRERGLSGESYYPNGAVRATVELVDRRGGPAVLLAFVVGAEAARWPTRPIGDRRAEVLAAFARLTETPPLDYLEADWGSEAWSAGCVPGLPPGALSAGASWREPYLRLHVAGTESAEQWPGYMEGAIEAGERAAREVLAGL